MTVTSAPNPGTGSLLGEITPTAAPTQPATAGSGSAGCSAAGGPLPLTPGQIAKILPSGLSAAPQDAPRAVKLAIAAGNQLVDKPYIWGGGHGQPLTQLAAGYDCSGSTSFVLGHHGSRGQAAVSLNDRIDALERHLHTLYAQRAGTMEPGEDWGWCASCGRNAVFPAEGEDTCRACLAELSADRAGRQP